MTADKVQKLYDIHEIQTLKGLFYEIIDIAVKDPTGAAPRLGALLVEDVKMDYGFGLYEGRAAAVKFVIEKICANAEWFWHAIHTPRIEVDGNTAVGHWTISGASKRQGKITLSYARLHDDFRRTPEGWRISYVRFLHGANGPLG